MSKADYSDPDIRKSVDEVMKTPSTNWVLVGYVPKSDSKLKVVGKGSGGLPEAAEQLSDGKVLFALVAFAINKNKKFAYIAWCGEGVTGMKKGLFNNHASDVAICFKGFHVQINARHESDVQEKDIVAKLTKASGASYDSGEKNQGSTKLVPTSVAQGRQQASQSTVKSKTTDKADYNKKNESEQFWNEQREDEEKQKQQKAQQPNPRSGDYNKSKERDQFWAQQKQEQTSQPSQRQTNVETGNSSNLKNKFENPPKNQPPTKSNNQPGPRKAVTPVYDAPTPPKKEVYTPPPQEEAPEPPIEETQQEEQQEEIQQEVYQEEQVQETYQEEVQEEQVQETYQEEAQQEEFQEEQVQEEQVQEEQVQEEQAQEEFQGESVQDGSGSQCRALYDYDAENPDDLSFKEGDIITVLDKTDPSGWFEGEVNGVRGFFPSNFVEEI